MNAALPGTGRLRLCAPQPRDARALAGALGGFAAAGWVAVVRRRWLTGDAFGFVVRRRTGGLPVGTITLDPGAGGPRRRAREGALSWRFAGGGRAPAREAAHALAAFGFDTLGLSRIRAPRGVGPLRRRVAGPGRPVVYAAAALLTDDRGRVLLARRPPGKAMAGLWEFPGGKVEPGETPRDALARELCEELGLRIPAAAFEPWDFAFHAYGGFHLIMPLMRCRRRQGEPRPREGQETMWVETARLGEFAMPAADRPLVERLLRPPLGASLPSRMRGASRRHACEARNTVDAGETPALPGRRVHRHNENH